MSELGKVFGKIEGYRDEIIELQGNLTSRVALGPENGGAGEHDKTEYIRERLETLKPDVIEDIKAPDERVYVGFRPNLIARWDGRDREKSPVWVLSHSDIVPPGDLSLWEGDPYEIRVEGDRIIGRGVEDNQHGFLSSYLAIKAIQESGQELKRTVGLAVVADEETGSQKGLDHVLRNHRGLFKDDALIIVPDGGNEEGTMIEVAEKSMLWLKFTVTGKQCHGSTPDKGKNSLHGAARLIIELEKLKEEFSLEDELFSPPLSTFAPTKIEANVPNINTIPGRDIFYVDCRILPQYRVEEIINSARGIANDVGNALGLTVQVEPVYRQDAINPTPGDAPVVKVLAKAIKGVTGLEAKPMGIGGGTVAAFFRQAGLPVAVWMTISDSAHQPNEYCLIKNIMTDAKVFASIYMDE